MAAQNKTNVKTGINGKKYTKNNHRHKGLKNRPKDSDSRLFIANLYIAPYKKIG